MANPPEGKLFEDNKYIDQNSSLSSANVWDQDVTKNALDELFNLTLQYRASKAYYDLLQFIAKFRFYSPFNAMLVHVQMPGARFVAPPHRWLRDYVGLNRVHARL